MGKPFCFMLSRAFSLPSRTKPEDLQEGHTGGISANRSKARQIYDLKIMPDDPAFFGPLQPFITR